MDNLLDLTNSKLKLEGNKTEQKAAERKINSAVEDLKQDRLQRTSVYEKRKDFYRGDQGQYSNVNGIVKDTKQKAGHTNQVTNYAGRTVVKIAFGIANNPPAINIPPKDINDGIEGARAQAVEDFVGVVLDSAKNRFWKSTFRRGAFIQAELGDFAIKTCIVNKDIEIYGHDDMASMMVGWNGNGNDYDFTIVENYLTPKFILDRYGIKVDEKVLGQFVKLNEEKNKGNAWLNNGQWNGSGANAPTGQTKLPKLKVIEYDSNDMYAIMIETELVQYIVKDDVTYPRVKMWTIVPNIPNPPSPWSIADIDYLMDLNVELNENDNRTADHLRVGNVQRYIAYNMDDFDPESIKTTSGQVIFVNDPDGKSKFEPLQTNINNFPDDQYNQRKLNMIYDMGLPKINYGASGAASGRSKAIDYQSSIDLTTFKRDAWELALQDIVTKIQILGHFLYKDKYDWFNDADGNFIVRPVEFDWEDVLPISQSDKIVNIVNKYNMIGIPLKQAYKELGYRNPDALIEELKQELKDPELMVLRSKAFQLSQGLLEANNQAATMAQGNADTGGGQPGGVVNQPGPVLNTAQNTGASKPMAAKGGTTTYSSAIGAIAKARQNAQAGGR